MNVIFTNGVQPLEILENMLGFSQLKKNIRVKHQQEISLEIKHQQEITKYQLLVESLKSSIR